MKNFLYFIFLIILTKLVLLGSSVAQISIIASVNDEIISNYDVVKEGGYLKVLNPNLDTLDNKKINQLAKQSLIKEIIKKKEISQFINIEKENLFADGYTENFLKRLGYKSEKIFTDELLKYNTYTFEEIKLKIKIELFWNELIFNKFNSRIKINEEKLRSKITNTNNEKKEFFLSEIVFKKNKNENIDNMIIKINKSINEIGFDNTANIYSISESSKFGGKIGWVKEQSVTKKIYEQIKNLKVNEKSNIIKLENNFIILKVNEIRTFNDNFDKEKELQKLIQIERNKKLEKFSRIYFNKVKVKYSINEK